MKVELPVIKCKNCGNKWHPRKSEKNICPRCWKEIKGSVELPRVKCGKCGHIWVPRVKEVKYCPKCINPFMLSLHSPIKVEAKK